MVRWEEWSAYSAYPKIKCLGFFIPGNLSGEIQLELLENVIYAVLVQVLENQKDHHTIISQQDRAAPYFVQHVLQFSVENFPHKWIG